MLAAQRQNGFTLIELMIVVVIIGILAGIAYPTYTNYVIRANQSEAQAFMMEVASRAEQFRLDARNYPADLDALDVTTPARVNDFYNVTLTGTPTAAPTAYVVQAAPRAGTRQEGQATLTLNSAGIKAPADEW